MEEQTQVNTQAEQPKNNKVIVIVLSIIIVITGGGLIYKYMESDRLSEEKAQKEAELEATYDRLDSISNELGTKILEISQLGGDIDTLLQIKEQLEADKQQLRNRTKRNAKQITGLKDRVSGYKALLLQQDDEIVRLKAINEELVVENTELKTETNVLNKSIRDLNSNKEELESKIAFAGRLKVEGMKILAINSNGKEREGEFKNRHIDKLKIQFGISENKVSPIEGKDIMIKITDPEGNVLFDVTSGSGTFILEGRELFYTAKQEILYDRTAQNLSFLYNKGSEYGLGKHLVEVYTDDYLMGKSSFIVK